MPYKVKDKYPIISLVILSFLLFSISAYSEEPLEEVQEKKEEKKEYIKDIVKKFNQFEGYIKAYQDPKTSSLYFSLKEEQLNKEFIYFAHVRDGVVAARRNRGSYLDNGVFRFEKHFETIRLVRVNTAFYLDPESALSKSSGANISDSVVQIFSIKSKDEEEKKFLINVTKAHPLRSVKLI